MVRRLTAPLVLVALVFALLVGTAPGAAAATNYTCPDSVCTFSVPDSYTEIDKQATSLTLKDANTGGVFSILLLNLPTGASLTEIVDASVREFSASASYSPDAAGVRDETVGGLSARSFTYGSTNSSGTLVIHKAYFVLRDGLIFNINFFVAPEQAEAYIGSANDILSSFQFA